MVAVDHCSLWEDGVGGEYIASWRYDVHFAIGLPSFVTQGTYAPHVLHCMGF